MCSETVIAATGALVTMVSPMVSHAEPPSPHDSTDDGAPSGVPEHADTAAHGAHEHHYVLGAKGSYAASIGEHGTHHLGGGGLFLEFSSVCLEHPHRPARR